MALSPFLEALIYGVRDVFNGATQLARKSQLVFRNNLTATVVGDQIIVDASGGGGSVVATVVNVLDFWLEADGSPTINGHTTRNIGPAFGRAYAQKIATTKHLTLWIPPCDAYGVAAWSWDEPQVINAADDDQWTLEIRGSGAASKIIPARGGGITAKLSFNAAGPASQSCRVWYHDLFWVGDSSTTTDCISLLSAEADLSVLCEDCTFYGLEASGEGLLDLSSDNVVARRLHFHGIGNADSTKAIVNVTSGFWGIIFQQVQFVSSEHATNPFGGAPFDKASAPCWQVWLQGDDLSHPSVARFDQCVFGTSAEGAVKADPTAGGIAGVRFEQCTFRDNIGRVVQATHDVGRIVLDGCIVTHNDSAVPSIELQAATCERLIVKRSYFSHAGLRIHANTGQRSVVVEDNAGGTWDCAGAGHVSVDEASTFDAFTGTETGLSRHYKVAGASVGGATVRLKQFDGDDISLADGKAYLIELRMSGGRTDAGGANGAAVRLLKAHTTGNALTIDDASPEYDGLPAGWTMTPGTSGLALTVDFTADAGTVEGYVQVTVHEVGAFTSGGFDLASLSWDLLLYDYSGAPLVGHASAGTSGANNANTDGSDPSVGTPLNGKGVATYDGLANKLKTAPGVDLAAIATAAAWSIAIVYNPASTQVGTPTTPYLDPCLLANADGIYGASSTSQGARAWKFDSAAGGTYEIDAAPDAATATQWAYLFARFDGTNIHTKLVKSGAPGSWSAGTPALTDWGGEPDTLLNFIGCDNTGVSQFFGGDIAFVGASKTAFSTGDFDNIKAGLNALFGLAF